MLSLLLAFCLLCKAASRTPEALLDKVDLSALPGASGVTDNFELFSGFIPLQANNSNGKNIFYMFATSQRNETADPLVMWTNGGPGCSGLLGLFTEHGPFSARSNGEKLVDNKWSWNRIANMLYVEIPAGVGFSYSNIKSDLKTNDNQTAYDNYDLLQGFLKRFPDHRAHDLYITSESYGGHYMPTLALAILDMNERNKNKPGKLLNLKGMAVGNPWVEGRAGTAATYKSYWGMQVVPAPIYKPFETECTANNNANIFTASCQRQMYEMDSYLGSLNPYALDFPICIENTQTQSRRQQHQLAKSTREAIATESATNAQAYSGSGSSFAYSGSGSSDDDFSGGRRPPRDSGIAALLQQVLQPNAAASSTLDSSDSSDSSTLFMGFSSPPAAAGGAAGAAAPALEVQKDIEWHGRALPESLRNPVYQSPPYEPCSEAYMIAYLRRPDVIAALHASASMWKWDSCAPYSRLTYSNADILSNTLPLYKQLMNSGLKILIYSGTDDTVCPTESTQEWIYSMGDVVSLWEPWTTSGQISGFVTKFDKFSFVTVMDAGHEVPAYQPVRGFQLWQRFLDGTWFQ